MSVRGLRYLERGLRRPYRDTVQRLVEALPCPLMIAPLIVGGPAEQPGAAIWAMVATAVCRCRRAHDRAGARRRRGGPTWCADQMCSVVTLTGPVG